MSNDINNLVMSSLNGNNDLADKLLEIFPFDDIKKELHDKIKAKTKSATESIEVDEFRQQTTPMIWDFCFEKVFFHEAVREEYLNAFEAITTMFRDYKCSQERAISVLDTVYKVSDREKGVIAGLSSDLPSNTDIMMVYMVQCIVSRMVELPDRAVSRLIERYMVITESSDGFYNAVLRIVNEKRGK
jgi:hypothetical protein